MRVALRVLIAVAILFPAVMSITHADPAPDVFITEIQTSSATSGSQEFIELYNNTDGDIDLADAADNSQANWRLQYFSSTKVTQPDFSWDSTAPTGEIALTGQISAHDYYLLSTYQPGNVAPDQIYGNPHLADNAGGIQLVETKVAGTIAQDHVGWSGADRPPPGFYASPAPGGSLQRQVDAQNSYADDQGNLGPFIPATTASPKEAWQTPADDDG